MPYETICEHIFQNTSQMSNEKKNTLITIHPHLHEMLMITTTILLSSLLFPCYGLRFTEFKVTIRSDDSQIRELPGL